MYPWSDVQLLDIAPLQYLIVCIMKNLAFRIKFWQQNELNYRVAILCSIKNIINPNFFFLFYKISTDRAYIL